MISDVRQASAGRVHRLNQILHILLELVLVFQQLQRSDISDGF